MEPPGLQSLLPLCGKGQRDTHEILDTTTSKILAVSFAPCLLSCSNNPQPPRCPHAACFVLAQRILGAFFLFAQGSHPQTHQHPLSSGPQLPFCPLCPLPYRWQIILESFQIVKHCELATWQIEAPLFLTSWRV